MQHYLINQKDWIHNFGLNASQKGTVIGKMFGVLVVKNHQNKTGYLAAFSGKLGGANHHAKFVPPVFDSLTENNFLNRGMAELNKMNQEISEENEHNLEDYLERISILKTTRRKLSNSLQQELFNNYHFLNQLGEEKSLNELFTKAYYKNPPAGAGECAGPKLLQYAFQHKMKPIAMAEFWWGSPQNQNNGSMAIIIPVAKKSVSLFWHTC